MKLCVRGMALSLGILWALGILVIGLVNRFVPGYGWYFLRTLEGLYPVYQAGFGLKNLLVGVLVGFVDGAICGALLAWFYNLLSCCCKKDTPAA